MKTIYRFLSQFYHFLGGVYFAILLISSVAILAFVGTLLESNTGSHRYAVSLTYGHPLFIFLLWLFVINILFSALRRWPFQAKHIPFLLTHLGLLLLLAGCLCKSYWGIQGNMAILEGAASNRVFISNTYTLQVEDRHHQLFHYNLERHSTKNSPFHDLKMRFIHLRPHSDEKLETWVKGPFVYVMGFKPFPLQEIVDEIPSSVGKIDLTTGIPWDVYAFQSPDIEKTFLQILQKHFRLVITNSQTDQLLSEITLKEAIKNGTQLIFQFSPINGIERYSLEHHGQSISLNARDWEPLWSSQSTDHTCISLKGTPFVAFVQDSDEDTFIFAFDDDGRGHCTQYRSDNLETLSIFDDGFSGYGVSCRLPFISLPHGKEERREAHLKSLEEELRKGVEAHLQLAPPLFQLQQACLEAQEDFAEVFVEILAAWAKSGTWLYDEKAPLSSNLKTVFEYFTFDDAILKMAPSATPEERIRLFTAWLRAYEIHLDSLPAPKSMIESDIQLQRFAKDPGHYPELETPVTLVHRLLIPTKKWEENQPAISVEFSEGEKSEVMTLAYDRHAIGLKWPILDGCYLVRFQPQFHEIPYTVRVRDARQVNYPNSLQAYSYECAILVKDNADNETEAIISMNHVYETWDGYRFYLANIAPPQETAVQMAQIVVNHDPAKYYATYPGGILLSLGIILLFYFRVRRPRK